METSMLRMAGVVTTIGVIETFKHQVRAGTGIEMLAVQQRPESAEECAHRMQDQ